MKKIILGLAVIASLSSVALALNNSNENTNNSKQSRILTCKDFHNCQTIHQPIYQHQACVKLGICINH
ncbi:hypothetical protein SB928_001644 [Campylobacter jejuni]|nr:hypothetical protein [Campylobacter jejuni]